MGEYKAQMVIEGQEYVITEFDDTGRRDMDHPDFPSNPMTHILSLCIVATQDLVPISAWIIEGQQKKDLIVEVYEDDKLLTRKTLYNAVCSDYKEYFYPRLQEMLCSFTITPEKVDMVINVPGLDFLNNLLK